VNVVGWAASFFKDGGPFMFLILGVGVLAVAIGIERSVVILSAGRVRVEKLLSRVVGALRSGHLDKAVAACRGGNAPLMRVGAVILDQPGGNSSEQSLLNSADAAASVHLAPLTRRLSYLVMLANVATLLGLLGTIFGLIYAFSAVNAADPSQRSALLAQGIAQALNTTAFGLIIAVPCLALHGYLVSQVESISDQVEEFSSRLISLVVRKRDLV
jgi:biopolymer transport protein ExbB/TolQ